MTRAVRERATRMLHTMNMSQLSLDMQAQYLNRDDVPMEQKANMTGVLLSHVVELKSKNQDMEKMIQQLHASVAELQSARIQKEHIIERFNKPQQQQHGITALSIGCVMLCHCGDFTLLLHYSFCV